VFRSLLAFALFAGSPVVAFAADDEVSVSVRVLDPDGQPIPTAVVRNPEERDRHRVNTETGEWGDTRLYLPDGTEVPFQRKTTVKFEISAPGYQNAIVEYFVKRKKNVIEVRLALQPVTPVEEEEEFNIGFGRDRPVE
jgi:hypothetical protein